MADYKAIKGLTIQTVAGDPSNLATGDIWYNSTLGKIRVTGTSTGSWATSNNLNGKRYHLGGFGSQTAAVAFGGYNYDLSPGIQGTVEEYDGSSWTEVNNISTDMYQNAGCGTLTAGLTYGGGSPGGDLAESFEYDGTNWTAAGNNTAALKNGSVAGTQTAALGWGGEKAPGADDQSNTYDGSSWPEAPDLNETSLGRSFCGIQTAALAISGGDGASPESTVADVEEYNGSSWSEGPNVNTGRSNAAASQQGTVTSTIAFTGDVIPGYTANCEEWDGTAWAEVGNVNNARTNLAAGGNYAAAVSFGGYNHPSPSPITVFTEEWTGDAVNAASVDVT